ncbi:hypothetical protein GCM10017044_05440 [Kordiimonas sediminis]|uniref:Tetratricopeptide repeat protein n=2 Tax=Kordiimonas sediminis TaxID=1735581 RepID=A0A919E302_9PROT|nr:hypothetical protein GCM10017044_05440 [Kordiimonas sediminis]
MQRLEKDLAAFDGHTVIFSSEYFPPGSEQDCQKLRDYLLTWAKEIQIVCYVRHPVSHAVSRSQQSLKMGFSTLDRPKETFFSPQKILPKFVRVFGKDAVTVRAFERDALQNGSVVSDFAALIGLSDDQQAHLQDKRGNESLSVEGAILSDALTRQFPRMVDGKWNPDRAQKITMMNIPGQKFTLPRSVLEGIMEECQPDIDYLQNEFGLTLKAPDLPASDTLAPTWGQGTIDSIAARMNATELRIQHLEAELALKDGMLLAREDKPLKAIEKFKQSVALKQDNWPAISRLVHHLCRTRQKEEAAKRLAAYRDMNPDEERVLAICEKYGLQLPA